MKAINWIPKSTRAVVRAVTKATKLIPSDFRPAPSGSVVFVATDMLCYECQLQILLRHRDRGVQVLAQEPFEAVVGKV